MKDCKGNEVLEGDQIVVAIYDVGDGQTSIEFGILDKIFSADYAEVRIGCYTVGATHKNIWKYDK